MDLQTVKEWIAAGDIGSVESAWLEALAQKDPPAGLTPVVEQLASAGRQDTAATLAWMLLEERADLPPRELLDVAKALLTAVPDNADLRARVADLYRQVFASAPQCLAGLLDASGLQTGQSPRRALRTLDLCLGLGPDAFLASRYEGRVVQVKGFNEALGLFDLLDESGRSLQVEPKLLADEYEPIDSRDFRVTVRYRPDEVRGLLAEDPAAVLVGMCLSRGGRINANDIKEFLVGRFLTPEGWSDWWSRARTAAKRSPNLTLEGRSPIVVLYHPGGRTLEEEMAAPLEAARTPMALHALLQQYLREAKSRKLSASAAFAGGILQKLAEESQSYLHRRPADALAAALAIEMAIRAGVPAPSVAHPLPADVLAGAQKPAELLAALEDDSLWSAGLEALSPSPQAAAHWRRLLYLIPAGRIEDVVPRLPGGPADEGLVQAATDALTDPMKHLELFLWLWQGPAAPPPGVPSRVELVSRLLKAVGDLSRQWDLTPARRKELWHRIRTGLSAADYGAFRAAAREMDEHVGATIKRQVERLEGLAQAVRENMLQVLRERFPALFYTREKVNPWEEEGSIWTTEAALRRREADLKTLTDVTIPANARAIGAAAAHGDLSENSEWKFAIEERDMLGARKMKMADEIARARILHPQDISTETVGIGCRVTLRRLSDGQEIQVAFLGPWDSDPAHGIYAYQTRLGLDLMGRPIGEELILRIEGEEETYRIEGIASAMG